MYVYDTESISGIVKRPRKTRPRPRIWGRGMVPYVEGQTSLSIATRQTKSREAEGRTEREAESAEREAEGRTEREAESAERDAEGANRKPRAQKCN